MKNIQVSSPETGRKIARLASIIFMTLAWLALAAALIWGLRYGHSDGDGNSWNALESFVLGICLTALVFIPIQLVRYFRQR